MIYFCPCLADSSIEALETVPTVDVGVFSLDTIMMRLPSAEETLSYLHQLKQTATAVLKEDLTGILEVYSIVANALFEKKPSFKSIKCAYILFLMRKEDFFFSERTVALFAELGLYISRLEIHYLLCAVFCGEYAQRRPVLLRYNQLTDISSDIDKASIAIFIEKMIKSVDACANMHFKKGVYNIPRAHEIPCSMSYVSASKEVYILLEKKSAYAFRIPSDPQIAVSTVVRHSSTTNLETLRIQERFSRKKGVWPVLGSITYAKSPDMFRKAIWFTPLPQCTLLQVSTGEVVLPIDILLEIIEQLAHGLAALHREGYRYGDIDAKNAFFSVGFNGQVTAGFGDFWAASYSDNGCGDFDEDQFKVDIWAFGNMLFPIFFEHAHLEETRAHLLEKGELLVQEACQLLICDMMRLDPNLRLNAETLLLRVSELKMNNSIIEGAIGYERM